MEGPSRAWRVAGFVPDSAASHYSQCVALRLVGSEIVHMDKGTRMWIQLVHLSYETAQVDRSLLASLLLRSGDLYKLDNPGAEDEHEYGCVTGSMGFHEFVVIDQNKRSVHLVVASDD